MPKQLYFLGDETVHMPVGGDFTPSGYIGPWRAMVLWKISYTDKVIPIEKKDGFKVLSNNTEKAAYYFFDPVKASTAAKNADVFAPQQTWRFETNKTDLLNVTNSEFLASMKDLLSYEVDVTGLRSKNRANFHMVALPMSVQATALYLGLLAEPVFSVSELTDQNTVYTDEFEARYIGSSDTRRPTDEGHYTNSTLWSRRAALWEALGEHDPSLFAVNSSLDRANTKADNLASCLATSVRSWNKPVWARLVLVNDPHMGATFGDDAERRQKVPVLWEIYENKDAAVAAAEADKERFSGGAAATTEDKPPFEPDKQATPSLSGDWALVPEDFASALASEVTDGGSNKEIAEALDCKVSEVIAWKKYLKL